MTAIATAEPFTDEFLDDLLPVLRQRAALGLWQLTAAASSTGPEKAVLIAAENMRSGLADPDQLLLRVAEALEQDEAWHSLARFQVATNLARSMLTGPDAVANEQMLYEQRNEWSELYQDTLQADEDQRAYLLQGTTSYDWTGRGGTAVWRAERRVDLQDFEDWLVKRPSDAVERAMRPPGWIVRLPSSWQAAHMPAANGMLPEPYARWAAEEKALVFPYRNRQAIWPLQRGENSCSWQPVPGIEPLIAAAEGLRPDQVTGFIEAVLINWDHPHEDEQMARLRNAMVLPADKAHAFGFITAEERQQLVADARASTLNDMDDTIDAFAQHPEFARDEDMRRALREARGNARSFRRLAMSVDRRIGSRFRVTRASWTWPGQSVARELLAGRPGPVVEWLATWAHKNSTLTLEEAMQVAWNRAFDRYGRRM
ncbi:hypothetical protein OG317_00035 [Streptomyces sp. NBC_01167]|uniref:hypothetical protein n=1 Tax=Streptomyces sp. NBC_01167 TaxID=2903756 RepID=UPI003870B8A8|nr:hypothetical protein OG317_00035 [Streptomyces sp. NBC_01167]